MNANLFHQMIQTKKELKNIPVIGNLDFGHTNPKFTFPVGGTAKLEADKQTFKLEIIQH